MLQGSLNSISPALRAEIISGRMTFLRKGDLVLALDRRRLRRGQRLRRFAGFSGYGRNGGRCWYRDRPISAAYFHASVFVVDHQVRAIAADRPGGAGLILGVVDLQLAEVAGNFA